MPGVRVCERAVLRSRLRYPPAAQESDKSAKLPGATHLHHSHDARWPTRHGHVGIPIVNEVSSSRGILLHKL